MDSPFGLVRDGPYPDRDPLIPVVVEPEVTVTGVPDGGG